MGMITEIKPEPRNNFIDGGRPRGYVHWEILDEDDNIIETEIRFSNIPRGLRL